MKIQNLLYVLIVSAFIAGCNKPVYKYNKDFEGHWLTTVVYDSTLHVNVQSEIKIEGEDGLYNGVCQVCSDGYCGCTVSKNGKAVMNSSKTQMQIGSGGGAVPLTIDEEPNIDSDGNWTMKVGGLRYYKN